VNELWAIGRTRRLLKPRPKVSTAFTTFTTTTTMFSYSICGSLVALIASVSAAPSLTLKTSTPDVNVSGLENLKVTTTITNTGDGTLKLLNDPRGVLNTFPENTFIVTNPAGSRPSFHGAKVNHPSSYPKNTRAHPFGFRF